jgi:uncharacterized protein YkwD
MQYALDAQLSRIARRHSRRMANRGSLFHNSSLVRSDGRFWVTIVFLG